MEASTPSGLIFASRRTVDAGQAIRADENCPQHITPRFTESEIHTMSAPLQAQVKHLKEQLAAVTANQPLSELGEGPLALVMRCAPADAKGARL